MIKKIQKDNLYDGIKLGHTWAFEYLEQTLFKKHLFELKGDDNLAFDIYHDVILDLFIKISEGKIEKREEESTGMIISWVKRNLDWKRRDYWKSSGFKDVEKIVDTHDQYAARQVDAESILYYKDVISKIEKMSSNCSNLLKYKLVDDLEWEKIYGIYPNENEGSLRVLFSKCLKALRQSLRG